MPPWLSDITTFHNVPVTVNGTYNGTSMVGPALDALLKIATPDDVAIIKLDIDRIHLEAALIERIVSEPALHSLIDELFFEQHYLSHWHEMGRPWGRGVLMQSIHES